MNCSTHPQQVASAYCRTCGRGLCPECQHNVRGVIYCEDCLAAHLGPAAPPPGAGQAIPEQGIPPVMRLPSPGLAAVLGFIPGVGAMYNGQFVKGLAHVAIFVGLVWAANSVDWFGWFIAFWVFYMAFDAYKTARAHELGLPLPDPFGFETLWGEGSRAYSNRVTPSAGASTTAAGFVPPKPSASGAIPPQDFASAGPPDTADQFKEAVQSVNRPGSPVGAIVLIGLGVLFLLRTLNMFEFYWMHTFWPLLLIGLGVWMFARRRSSARCQCQACQARCLMGPAIVTGIGVLLLLNELGTWRFHSSWPVILIIIGAVMILRRGASREGHVEYVAPVPRPPVVTPPVPVVPERELPASNDQEVRNG